MILSEALDEKAIDILVELAFWKQFPEQCEMWRSTKKDVRETFKKEATLTIEAACKDLRDKEDSVRSALRESVVDDVMKLFP